MNRNRISRRQFLETAAGFAALAASAGCATRSQMADAAKEAQPGVARLAISRPSKFAILQFTDVHLFAGRDGSFGLLNERTVDDMRKVIKLSKPDLIVVTGDLWRDNPHERLEEFMRYSVEQCGSFGVPWAFAWGNHDQLNDYNEGHKALTAANNSLYRGSDSGGNYAVDIVNHRGKCVWQLLFLNSEGTGICAKQQDWMREFAKTESNKPVPKFAFFHIPLKQYVDVWTSGKATGYKAEEPCIEQENGSSLSVLKQIGVTACFCGHDHVNDYSGVVDGVDLVYGRASGRGGYGALNLAKGGKLITLNCKTGKYEWESVLPDGRRWRPKAGEHIEEGKK